MTYREKDTKKWTAQWFETKVTKEGLVPDTSRTTNVREGS